MVKAGNLKLDFMAKSIGTQFFEFEDMFRCYRDNENLKKHFGYMDTLIFHLGLFSGHFRYINIQAWLRDFRVKNAIFSSLFCLSIPKRDLDTKKTTPNIQV